MRRDHQLEARAVRALDALASYIDGRGASFVAALARDDPRRALGA